MQQNLPLTTSESNLLAECARQRHLAPKEQITVDHAGTVVVHRTNDAEPVMQAMKAYGDIIDKHHRKGAVNSRMVGSIDPITAAIWAKETGLKIGTKEFAEFAVKRIKNDSDYRYFRVGH